VIDYFLPSIVPFPFFKLRAPTSSLLTSNRCWEPGPTHHKSSYCDDFSLPSLLWAVSIFLCSFPELFLHLFAVSSTTGHLLTYPVLHPLGASILLLDHFPMDPFLAVFFSAESALRSLPLTTFAALMILLPISPTELLRCTFNLMSCPLLLNFSSSVSQVGLVAFFAVY